MSAPIEPADAAVEPLHPAVAAALSLPPMTEAECAEVARIFAAIERKRQHHQVPDAERAAS